MKRIAVYNRGKVVSWTLVDAADYPGLSASRWYADGHGYVVRRVGTSPNHTTIYMHRAILEAPPHLVCDHINGRPLDNRRSNLRLATRQQNNRNVGPRANNKGGGFKGVRWYKNAYEAAVVVDGKRIYIGRYQNRHEAAWMHDQFAIQLHEDFAWTNFNYR